MRSYHTITSYDKTDMITLYILCIIYTWKWWYGNTLHTTLYHFTFISYPDTATITPYKLHIIYTWRWWSENTLHTLSVSLHISHPDTDMITPYPLYILCTLCYHSRIVSTSRIHMVPLANLPPHICKRDSNVLQCVFPISQRMDRIHVYLSCVGLRVLQWGVILQQICEELWRFARTTYCHMRVTQTCDSVSCVSHTHYRHDSSTSTPFVVPSKYATHSDVRVTQTCHHVRSVHHTHSRYQSPHPNQPLLCCSPNTQRIPMCVSHRRVPMSEVCVPHTLTTSRHIQINPLCIALHIRHPFGCACHTDVLLSRKCVSHTLPPRVITSKSNPYCIALQMCDTFGCVCHSDTFASHPIPTNIPNQCDIF